MLIYIVKYIMYIYITENERRENESERGGGREERDSTILRIISPQVIYYYVFEPGSLVSLRLTD